MSKNFIMDSYDLKNCMSYLLDVGMENKNPHITVNIPSSDFDSVINDIFITAGHNAKNILKYNYVDDITISLAYYGGQLIDDIYYILTVKFQKNTMKRLVKDAEVYFIIERIGKDYHWLDDYGETMMKNAERREITLFSLLGLMFIENKCFLEIML